MNRAYIIGGAAVAAFFVWRRASATAQAKVAIAEPAQSQSSDWQGDMWQRLDGSDLVVRGRPNAHSNHAHAAPSHADVSKRHGRAHRGRA